MTTHPFNEHCHAGRGMMRTVNDVMSEQQAAATAWVKWGGRLEALVLASPVECHCWDLDRVPFRNASQGHTGDCDEWRRVATAIRRKPKMLPGPEADGED